VHCSELPRAEKGGEDVRPYDGRDRLSNFFIHIVQWHFALIALDDIGAAMALRSSKPSDKAVAAAGASVGAGQMTLSFAAGGGLQAVPDAVQEGRRKQMKELLTAKLLKCAVNFAMYIHCDKSDTPPSGWDWNYSSRIEALDDDTAVLPMRCLKWEGIIKRTAMRFIFDYRTVVTKDNAWALRDVFLLSSVEVEADGHFTAVCCAGPSVWCSVRKRFLAEALKLWALKE